MSHDDSLGAPADWYPDPLGHPQLRWWNGTGWTEQVSAAPEPLVMQSANVSWKDEEPVAVVPTAPTPQLVAPAQVPALIEPPVVVAPAEPIPVLVERQASPTAPYTKYAQSNWQPPVGAAAIITSQTTPDPRI